MKAHIPINAKQRQEIQKIARETLNSEREKLYNAVNNEKDDIAKRCMYLSLLTMQQIGLSPRTMRRAQDALPAVTEKYMQYRVEQLADEWARITLQDIGVETPETKEKL